MVGIVSGAAGEMLFGLLNDATRVWFPIFLGAAGVAAASLLFRKLIVRQEVIDQWQEKIPIIKKDP